ncbi:glycosyltransferase involved in cell wall biosynthesis [Nonomuraea thailandensis]|uniref:Glycosyltransferase involved in cell wall biosynthesis n=1 Tax=Nonomuraea thailandensis TaxID=1188745 RepID=A0A9X2K9R5_9ACTN|nr:glycosyltransferase [Nonomuraea thailandensis]MCP2362111.1 glycosyltransferase involved in cell wall biosynthesis [Nonomuraea thailandensis]
MTVVFTCLDADTLGGVQQVTHTLAQGLARRGHEVHVIGLQRAAAPFRYVDRPLYHHHVVGGRPAAGALARRRADRRLRALLGEIGPGYAVMTSPSVVARAARLLPGSLRPIGQYHGSYDHARDCWHLASIRRHYPGLDQAVFLSEDDARLFSEHALLPNASALPNPLAAWPAEMSVLESPRVLGVGRLEAVKRFDRLITAFARSGAPEPWELHLIGDGGELERLRAHARSQGVADRVVFRGRVPAADLPAEYLRASVLGLTSEYEGLPVVLLESAAHGVPAVAFDVSGGVRSAGPVLVPPGDVDAFAVELGRLVDDEEERRRLGADARARVEAFRLGHVLDRWESLFAHIER